MQLKQNQLKHHLSKTLAPLYVLIGDEPLGQSECLDEIRKNARANGADERSSFIVERFFNWQQISQFSQSMSLFSSKRILEIRIPSGKPGVDGSQSLIEIANNLMQDTTIIIVLPTLEREAKKSAWFEAIEEKAQIIELAEFTPSNLPQWIASRLALQNQSADAASLAFMSHQVEGNMLAAHQEVQKLALLYPAGELSAEAITSSVLNVSRFNPFQLGEAMLLGDISRTVRILQGLQEEGEQAVAVMNPLTWLLRPLLRIKQAEARGEDLANAMASAKVFPNRQPLYKRAISRLSLRQIEAALQKCCDIDRIAKGVKQGDAWLEISRLCFGLAKVRGR